MMQVVSNFPFQANHYRSKALMFGSEKNHYRLYEPIRKPESDRFTAMSASRNMYPPIEISAPEPSAFPHPTTQLVAPASTSVRAIGSIEEKAVESKQAFIDDLSQHLEATNPAINPERIQRRINVQVVLDVGLKSLANVIALGSGHAWAAVFLPLINVTTSKASAWAADKISDTLLGRALSGAFDYAKKGFHKFLNIFSSKQPGSVRFSGNSTKTENNASVHEFKLLSNTLNAIQDFANKLNSRSAQEPKAQMVTTLFGNMFASMGEYIAQEGSSREKEQLATLNRIRTETQEIAREIPASAKNFNDIPILTRKKLLSVVYDALTSSMPEMVQWGEGLGQDLGIPAERMNQLKGVPNYVR